MTNFMKATVVAATLALGSTAAYADNSFALQNTVMDSTLLTLDLVNSDTDGVVVVYDYSNGEFGEVLGQTEVKAGANPEVKIEMGIDGASAQDLAAVLYNGPITTPTEAAAWTELDVENDG